MTRSWWTALAPACLLLGLGCSSARMVSWDGAEGVVAIPRDTDVWPCYSRTAADKLMAEKCPGGYRVVEAWEVASGKTAISTGGPTSRTEMGDSTEFRIKFRPTGSTPGPER